MISEFKELLKENYNAYCKKYVDMLVNEKIEDTQTVFNRFSKLYFNNHLTKKVKEKEHFLKFDIKLPYDFAENSYLEFYNKIIELDLKYFEIFVYPIFICNHWILVSDKGRFIKDELSNLSFVDSKVAKINKYLSLVEPNYPEMFQKVIKFIGLYLRGNKGQFPYKLKVKVDKNIFLIEFYTYSDYFIFDFVGTDDFIMFPSVLEYLTSYLAVKEIYFSGLNLESIRKLVFDRVIKLYAKNIMLGKEKLFDVA